MNEFLLKDKSGYYSLDESGNVTHGADRPQPFSSIELMEETFGGEPNRVHADSPQTSVRITEHVAKILRHIFYTKGGEGRLQIEFLHSPDLDGFFDFSVAIDSDKGVDAPIVHLEDKY